MKNICKKLQMLIAENGPSSLMDDMKAQEHLLECAECFEFLEVHSVINEKLCDISGIDAPDDVVDELVAKVAKLNRHVEKTKKHRLKSVLQIKRFIQIIGIAGNYVKTFCSMHFSVKSVVASGFVVVMVCGLMFSMIAPKLLSRSDDAKSVRREAELNYARESMDLVADIEMGQDKSIPKPATKPVESTIVPHKMSKKEEWGTNRIIKKQKAKKEFKKRASKTNFFAGGRSRQLQSPATEDEEVAANYDDLSEESIVEAAEEYETDDEFSENLPSVLKMAPDVESDISKETKLDKLAVLNKSNANELNAINVKGESHDGSVFYKKRESVGKTGRKKRLEYLKDDSYEVTGKISDDLSDKNFDKNSKIGSSKKMILENFFNERASLENLNYKKAEGYWANTYLPGDPKYRWLDSQLGQWDRSKLVSHMHRKIELDEKARRVSQPFDLPVTAALGVFLHADRRGIQEKSRMLVQVGIKGTQRLGGSRSGMNVGIVLDLRGDLSEENLNCFKALLTEFCEARDMGDRFSLIVAGKPGAVVIEPGNFKYGHLSVAMKHLFGNDEVEEETLGVVEAIGLAAELVSSGDDPTAPLGSSEVILVTSQSIKGLIDNIAEFAHKSAIGGAPVSVIGIGNKINPEELNRIIYSGQGHRRLITLPSDAANVVEQELSAVSRVIARAVRLRIRLAKGVQLVEVFDSHRLDEINAKKIKDAEKSIDLRMAKNLGIKADRGDDEDGIQIVIPSFYAGDSHVVLLDIVASGPGPVADVTVRYKDLVKLKNGVARANLSLDRTTDLPGPLERNVLKNLLARKLSKTLADAGNALASGDDIRTLDLLQSHHDLLVEIRSNRPGFQRDHDVLNDIVMLNDYLAVLNKGGASIQKQRPYLADSLKLAGKLKVLPRLNRQEIRKKGD